MRAQMILDNGGGVTLQIGEWAHSYTGRSCDEIAQHVADDLATYLADGHTHGWDGDDPDARIDPTADATHEAIRNGGYRIIDIETIEQVAEDCAWGSQGDAISTALLARLERV